MSGKKAPPMYEVEMVTPGTAQALANWHKRSERSRGGIRYSSTTVKVRARDAREARKLAKQKRPKLVIPVGAHVGLAF